MCVRLFACAFVVLCAGAISAQTSVALNGKVRFDHFHAFHIRVDHGSTPKAIDITATVSTNSTAGLAVTILDFDLFAELDYPIGDFDDIDQPGQVTVVFDTPVRTGVHDMMIIVETALLGLDSTYVGTASVSAGTIANVGFAGWKYEFTGARVYFGRMVDFFAGHDAAGIVSLDFELDFGDTPHTTTFAVLVYAEDVIEHRLLDGSSGTPTVVKTLSASFGEIDDEYTYTTASYSGIVPFRLEVTNSGATGFTSFALVIGPDVKLISPTNPTPKPKKRSKPKSATGCATHGAPPWGAVAPAIPMIWAIARRRRAHG